MIVHTSSAVRSALAQAYLAQIGAGATLSIYGGTMPLTPETAVGAQPLIGTLTCATPAASMLDGVLTFAPLTTASALINESATWARLLGASAVSDFDVTALSGSGAVRIENVAVTAGRTLHVLSFAINFGS